MKKIFSCVIVILLLSSVCSCNLKGSIDSVMKLGDSQKSSNVISGDFECTEPLIEEKGYSVIGDIVDDVRFYEGTGIQISYKIKTAEIYNDPADCGIDKNEICMSELFYESDGSFSGDYDFLLLEIDILCAEFKKDLNIRPNITRFSSVGVSSEVGRYEPVSVEQLYFSVNGKVKSADSKDYYYYDITEGETVSVVCGWMIPSNINDDLFLSIGSVHYSSDGSASDDSVIISLS